jgi:hypothetical protein
MVDLDGHLEQRHQEFLEFLASGSNSQGSDTASLVRPNQTEYFVMLTAAAEDGKCLYKERQVSYTEDRQDGLRTLK